MIREVTTHQVAAKRKVVRTCLYCQREYTCWAFPDAPDDFCSEKCEKALEELYSIPEAVPSYVERGSNPCPAVLP